MAMLTIIVFLCMPQQHNNIPWQYFLKELLQFVNMTNCGGSEYNNMLLTVKMYILTCFLEARTQVPACILIDDS